MARNHVEMTMVTPMRANQPAHDFKNGIRIERIGKPKTNVMSIGSFFVRALFRALTVQRRPNVVLLLSVSPISIPLILILKAIRIRTVYVSTMARADAKEPKSIVVRLINSLKFLIYNSFDCLVCSTRALMEDLTVLRIRPEKIKVIPNGVSLSKFRPSASREEIQELRQTLRLPMEGPIVLYVGLRIDRKGVIALVEAWKLYRKRGGPGWLIMVGQELRDEPEFEQFYHRWDNCLATVRPSDQIEIRGAQKQIQKYYRAADLFVILSELEGTPNVLPEAMASGLPVLTTQFRGYSRELGGDGSELIITNNNPMNVCHELDRLLSNHTLRRSLGDHGRIWVEKYQDIDKSIDQYTVLFRSLIGKDNLRRQGNLHGNLS